MRHTIVLLSLGFGVLTAGCTDQGSFGPSQPGDVTISTAKGSTTDDTGTTSGKKKIGGSAGGVKGTGK